MEVSFLDAFSAGSTGLAFTALGMAFLVNWIAVEDQPPALQDTAHTTGPQGLNWYQIGLRQIFGLISSFLAFGLMAMLIAGLLGWLLINSIRLSYTGENFHNLDQYAFLTEAISLQPLWLLPAGCLLLWVLVHLSLVLIGLFSRFTHALLIRPYTSFGLLLSLIATRQLAGLSALAAPLIGGMLLLGAWLATPIASQWLILLPIGFALMCQHALLQDPSLSLSQACRRGLKAMATSPLAMLVFAGLVYASYLYGAMQMMEYRYSSSRLSLSGLTLTMEKGRLFLPMRTANSAMLHIALCLPLVGITMGAYSYRKARMAAAQPATACDKPCSAKAAIETEGEAHAPIE